MLTRYAIIDGINVVNVIEYENAPGNPPPGFPDNYIAVQSDIASPGWKYENGEFIDPTPPPPPPPPFIPQQVPMWAVRTVLQNDGLFDQAQALIEGSTDNALKNVWEYGNFADRNSKSIMSLATALGLTSEQVDQMFIDANNIVV